MSIFYILLAITSGICMAVQSPVNATLSRHAGHLQATTVSFGGGALVLGILMLIIGTGDLSRLADAQWWQFLGGLYGIYIVLVITYGIPRLGAALTSTILTLGNLMTAAVLDTFGLMGLPKVELEPGRIAGILIVLTGVILVYIGKRKQETGGGRGKDQLKVILMLALGGVAGAIQAPTNNALAGHVGTVEASFVSFSVGFLAILLIALIATKGHLLKDKKEGIEGWMLTGGIYGGAVVFINLTAIAVLGSTVLQIGTMLGQLSGGMAIDSFGLLRTNKIKANSWRWAGMLIIAVGVTIVALTKL
ncbi:MAG: DMT family transporter [Firmicutes bacterium]|nr:DMT family transporter [Bacillota bacterium]